LREIQSFIQLIKKTAQYGRNQLKTAKIAKKMLRGLHMVKGSQRDVTSTWEIALFFSGN